MSKKFRPPKQQPNSHDQNNFQKQLIESPDCDVDADEDSDSIQELSHFKLSPIEEIKQQKQYPPNTSHFIINPIKMEKILDSTPRGRIDTDMTDIEMLEAQLQLELTIAKQKKKDFQQAETLEVLAEVKASLEDSQVIATVSQRKKSESKEFDLSNSCLMPLKADSIIIESQRKDR